MLFPEAPAFCDKNISKQFLLYCTSIWVSSKCMYQIFKILFQIEDINIFLLRNVFFRKHVQLKSLRRDTWSLSDSNGTRTHNHLVHKRTLSHLAKVFVYKLSGCGFEFPYCYLKSLFFWQKKHQRWNLRHTLVEKLSKFHVAKY